MTEKPTLPHIFNNDDFTTQGVLAAVNASVRAASYEALEHDGLADGIEKLLNGDPYIGIPGFDVAASVEGDAGIAITEPGFFAWETGGPEFEAKAYNSVDIKIPGAADMHDEIREFISEIAIDIPPVKNLDTGMRRMEFDTFTFRKDFPSTARVVTVIVIIAVVNIILLYYLFHF